MKQHGFTLIELMVTIAIAAILLGLGVSSFGTMMASTQARTTADSIMSGLRLARAEAIKRNAPMRFQLVSTTDNTCTFSAASALWVVTQTDAAPTTRGLAANYCGSMPYTPPDQPDICSPAIAACSATVLTSCRGAPTATNPNPSTCSSDPLIAFKSDSNAVNSIAVAASGLGVAAYAVTFNPLGRVMANAEGGASLDTINITPSDTSAKKWRIRITASSGSLKQCDPDAAVATTSAQAC